jgi:hypothetical protein
MAKAIPHRRHSHLILISDILSHLEKFHDFQVKWYKKTGYNDMVATEIEIMRALFGLTGNPLFAWRAIMCCGDVDLDLPDWVMDYLFDSATKLAKSIDKYEKGPDEGKFLKESLNFKNAGRSNRFKNYKDTIERYSALSEIFRRKMEDDCNSWEDAATEIAYNLEEGDAEAEALILKLEDWRQQLQKISDDLDLG